MTCFDHITLISVAVALAFQPAPQLEIRSGNTYLIEEPHTHVNNNQLKSRTRIRKEPHAALEPRVGLH